MEFYHAQSKWVENESFVSSSIGIFVVRSDLFTSLIHCHVAAISRMAWRPSLISAHMSTTSVQNYIRSSRSKTKNANACWNWERCCVARPISIASKIWPQRRVPDTHCNNCRVIKIMASQKRATCWRKVRAKCDVCGRNDVVVWQPMASWTFTMPMSLNHPPEWIYWRAKLNRLPRRSEASTW